MGTAERRNEIMKKLCRRRYDTIANLSSELGVSRRTIQRDIYVLSTTEPIYTQTGKYGGVFVVEGYSLDRMYMLSDEIALLKKINKMFVSQKECMLNDSEIIILQNIIKNYTKPTN